MPVKKDVLKKLITGELIAAESSAAEHIPYSRLLDNETLVTGAGDLISVLALDGIPVETLAIAEIEVLKDERNQTFKALSNPNIALWTTIVRRRETRYPDADFEPGFAADVDLQWRQQWEKSRRYRNELYITVVRKAPTTNFSLFASKRRVAAAAESWRAKAKLELETAVRQLRSAFGPYGSRVLSTRTVETDNGPIESSELLEFIHGLIHQEWGHPFAAPRQPLRNALARGSRVSFSLQRADIEIRDAALKPRYGAMLGVVEYPPGTAATMLDVLSEVPVELVVTQSYEFANRAGVLEDIKRQKSRYKSAEDAAESLAEQLHEARDGLASNRFGWGYHHFSVLVLESSREALADAVSTVSQELAALSIKTTREVAHMEPLFWAQLPGNSRYIGYKAGITTTNLACLFSGHAFPEGRPSGNHWGPALTALETRSGTPYYLSLHVADVGHTFVLGPTGSGKTTATGFLLLQAQRVQPRIVLFDKDRGAEISTRAMGGQYTVIRDKVPTGWNPFALPDSPETRTFLRQLLMLIVSPKDDVPSAEREMLAKAVDSLFQLDQGDRRLSHLDQFIQITVGANSLKKRLAPWHGKGDLAWVFDNPSDEFKLENRVQGFDLTTILGDAIAAPAVVWYLFHQTQRALDGTPTIISFEEGWYFLDNPLFKPVIKDLLLTIRKRNGLVIFSMQRAKNATDSELGRTIIEQCPTRLFFPNNRADLDDLMTGMKLTKREAEIVTRMSTNSRCFLVRQDNHSVVCRLDLGNMPEVIAVLSGTTERIEKVDELRDSLGDAPAKWLPAYLQWAKQQSKA